MSSQNTFALYTHINHGKSTKNLDLLHLANMRRLNGANVKDVHGVIVTDVSGKLMLDSRVLPSLRDGSVAEWVCLVRPDVDDVARLVLFVIVEDWIFPVSITYPSTYIKRAKRGEK